MAFKCPECKTKHVQLCGLFGHWPPKEMEDLSPQTQITFWATPTKNKADVEKLVLLQVVTKFIERKRVKDRGIYLPISVYQTCK